MGSAEGHPDTTSGLLILILPITEGKVFSRAEYLGPGCDSQEAVGGDDFEFRNRDAAEQQQPRVSEKQKQKRGEMAAETRSLPCSKHLNVAFTSAGSPTCFRSFGLHLSLALPVTDCVRWTINSA